MRYLKVEWRHQLHDEPSLLFSELDDEGYEVRKVEAYENGSYHWADRFEAIGDTRLGELPVPSFEDISAQDEFMPTWIDRNEFEKVWQMARADFR
jgi:hypothetical protein